MSEGTPQFRPPRPVGGKPTKHSQRLGDMSVAMLGSLLNDTLDPGYRQAAERRRSDGGTPTSSRGRAGILVVVGVMIAGLVFGVAYQNDTRSKPDQTRTREALVAQIDQSQETADGLTAQVVELREQVTAARNDLLNQSTRGSALLSTVTELEYQAGQVVVTGPGVTITISDPPAADGGDPVGGQAEPGLTEALIQDRDLQKVANALWVGGAEAIAINGQRLGPTTAIRQAGGAILVDFLPISSPYVIEAVGPYNALAVELAGSAIGRKLATYRNVYAAGLEVAESADLVLPAALATTSTYAVPVEEGEN